MKVLRTVETISPANDRQQSTKNIYQKLLEQILLKSHTLTNSYLDQCSEQWLLIKIWSYMSEEFFGYQIVTNADESMFEAMTGEAAKTNATRMKKFYTDKLKTVLATKCQLNHFIMSTPLTASEIKKVQMPIIQIIGTTCHISALKLIDKGVYILDQVARLQYPMTIKQLRSGGIEDLLNKLEIIKVTAKDFQETRRSSFRGTAGGVVRISNDKRKQMPKQPANVCVEWFSNILWTSDSDTEEDIHGNNDEEYSDLEEEAHHDDGSDDEFGSSEDIS
ncbi:hypothetical protein BJV82DRAFT_668449 [Fennellomyces sp. T-0311]|nr:hypothetical protein BJV82DRAFT_668449 [Fennellomyces sp. T-0311]